MLQDLDNKINELLKDVKAFNKKYSDYQQTTQLLVQLSFLLIATAIATIVITSLIY
jgi:hypothetical protein